MNTDIKTVLADLAEGAPQTWDGVSLSTAVIRGRRMLFATDTDRDIVQNTLRGGSFYETEELERIAEIFPEGGTFLDVGANIGNHSLFVAAFCKPARVVPIEPNPRAWRLLIANVVANGLLGLFDLSRLGYGLADRDAGGYGMQVRGKRLGSLKMQEGGGDLAVRRGDTFLADLSPDLVKIDVEGMELVALSGLDGMLDAVRPLLMVEVEARNEEAFLGWLEERGYRVRDSYAVNDRQKNFIAGPVAAAVAG